MRNDGAPFLRVNDHWETSLGLSRSAVVLSDLPRGASPVVSRTRVLNFVIEGTEHYELDGRTYLVRGGEFLVLDAGIEARVVMAARGRTRGLCIYLPATPDEDIVEAHHVGEVGPLAVRAFQMAAGDSPFGRRVMRVGRHVAMSGRLSANAASDLVEQARSEFSSLHGSLALDLTRIDAAKPSTRQDILQRVYRARTYLCDHPGETVSLGRLAREVGMSQFHLARSFKAIVGVPPARYHAERRIGAVEAALRAGRVSVADAAIAAGFADVSSFSRAFKRVVGTSPSYALGTRPSEGTKPNRRS